MRHLHPLIVFFYFFLLMTVMVLFWSPVFLGMALVFGLSYVLLLKGRGALGLLLSVFLMMMIIIGLNPLINHQGVTILGYVWNRPLTLEALCYGGAAAMMSAGVMLWSVAFQACLSSQMLMAVLGKPLPTLTLILSMILNMMPRMSRQFVKIKNARKGLGEEMGIKSHLLMLSMLLSWVLESGLITADAMSARGYGTARRTSYTNYRWGGRQTVTGLLVLGCMVGSVVGMVHSSFTFFPDMSMHPLDGLTLASYFCFGCYCAFPIALHVQEVALWRSYRLRA